MWKNVLEIVCAARSEAELLERFVRAMIEATGVRAVAIVAPEPPLWRVASSAGADAAAAPVELAAEALDRDEPAEQGGWQAAAETVCTGEAAREPLVLLIQGRLAASPLGEWTSALALSRRLVRERTRLIRLESLLDVTHAWRQANDLKSLLAAMAETAARLFSADRASVFLWDKANRELIGRPALGVKDGELRVADDAGVVGQVVQTGLARRVSRRSSRDEVDRTADRHTGYRTESLLCVPLVGANGERFGAFELLNKQDGDFTPEDQAGLVEIASYAAVALANTRQFDDVLARHVRLVDQAARGVRLLGNCSQLQALRSTITRVADTDLAVMVTGENGAGKEVVAQSLHYQSRRRNGPLLAVNCAALAESLLESELFGHEKGAFTDAHETRAGKFELASGGTLLLDEIGDMSLGGQAKLLRVLEDKTVVRVGGVRTVETDTRVVAATNKDLAALVREGRFREDLFFRLNVISLDLPPLRSRGDDVLLLAETFLTDFCRKVPRAKPEFTAAAQKRLAEHRWPGNVRELRNLIERVAYLTNGDEIDAEDLAFIISPRGAPGDSIDGDLPLNEATHQFQREYIRRSIEQCKGGVSDAAERLGMHRSNLYRKMRQLGMTDSDSDE